MKCSIIQDLLPIYCDDLTSEDSREEIEKHLAECEICRDVYENMKTKEMLALYGVAKTSLQSNNGTMINVEKTYLTGYDLTMYVNNLRSNVYTFQYYPQSLQEIVDAMNVTLGKKKADLE